MPLVDILGEFDDDDAITVDRDSSDVVDLGTASQDLGPGTVPMCVLFTVGTAFATGTSLQCNISTGATNALGTTIASSAVIVTATLVADYQFVVALPPSWAKLRWIGVEYDVTVTMTAGTITAQLMPTSGLAASVFA